MSATCVLPCASACERCARALARTVGWMPMVTTSGVSRTRRIRIRFWSFLELQSAWLASASLEHVVDASVDGRYRKTNPRHICGRALPDPRNDDGVGDVPGSVGFDGGRGLLFVNGSEYDKSESSDSSPIVSSWKKSDTVGVIYDAGERSVQYTLNGNALPFAKAEDVNDGVVMAVSINTGGEVRLKIGNGGEFMPDNCRPISDLVLDNGGLKKRRKVAPESRGEFSERNDFEDANNNTTTTTTERDAVGATSTAATTTTSTTATTTSTTTSTVGSNSKSTTSSSATQEKLAEEPASPLAMKEIKSSHTLESLSQLSMETLKVTLKSLGLKAGGTALERANRLWQVKDISSREDVPKKIRDKATFDDVTRALEMKT